MKIRQIILQAIDFRRLNIHKTYHIHQLDNFLRRIRALIGACACAIMITASSVHRDIWIQTTNRDCWDSTVENFDQRVNNFLMHLS